MQTCCSERALGSLGSQRKLQTRSRIGLRVENAISRQKKEAIVETVKSKLKESTLVFGMTTRGLKVEQMEKLRQSMPETANVYVCKNSLLKIAAEQVEGWGGLCSVSKNAWIFVDEDGISSSVKSWISFQQEETKILKSNAEKDQIVPNATEICGGVLNGKPRTPEDILKLKDLPTRSEALASLLGMLNSIPASFLMTLNQSPLTLAVNVQRISEFDEDKTKQVKEFLKTETAAE